MPYIEQYHRKLLEEDLTCLANKICDIYQTTRFRSLAYKYVCLKLGIKVLPQRRYAALSAVRAIYSDASFEWRRRLKVKPKKFKDVVCPIFPPVNDMIKNLSEKIISIASQYQKPNFSWQGPFNYSITVLGLKILGNNKNKEFSSLIAGVLEYLHNHFYEVEMAVYENEQIIKNGDVF